MNVIPLSFKRLFRMVDMQISAKYMQKLLLQASYPQILVRCCHKLLTDVQGPYNHVNGERTAPVDDMGTTTVMEPALGVPLCTVPVSGEQEVSRAVKVAKEAFCRWSQTPAKVRGRLLRTVGQKIRHNLEDIARLEVRDTGKPIWEARVDIESCADSFDYFGGVISSYAGQHIPINNTSFAMVCREPLGVIAGVGAWNFPMQTCTWKVAPALACGNTMVYKPSQLTPLTAVVLSQLVNEAGVPPGTLNIVQGDGKTGHLLCQHPDVSKISFTGSVSTGSAIMKTASDGLKKITLELGGKSPLIIFDDADMVNAVKATLLANFLTQGEVCSNGTRVFVHENIVTEFIARLLDATIRLKIGNPFDEDTTIGATISAEHAEKVLCYIQEAKGEGANVVYGGERVILPSPLDKGYYLSPCILVNCHDNMRIVQEEVFGAVVSILTFSTEDEVVQRANNTPFGLAGGVFTRNLQRAFRVVQNIEAGTIWVNNYNIYPPELPFGGYKKSGMGRENGMAVLDYYTQQKTVFVELGDVDCGPLYRD